MRLKPKATLLLGLLGAAFAGQLALTPAPARADQRHDWMLDAPKKGTFLNLDFIFGAVQAGLEQRIPVYGNANMVTLRASSIAAIPFGGAQLDAEIRIVVLTLGVSGGYTSVWRNQTFALGAPMDRKERREREAAGEFNTDNFGFLEGRASLALPFNDYLLFNWVNSMRVNGATDRSFDNNANVVDDGETLKLDFQLFFKHERIGGIAPMFQILNFQLDNDWKTQFNYGFMLVGRAGLVQRDDLLMLQMLFTSGPIAGAGIDNRAVYGSAPFRGPFSFLLVYRSQISL
jgi:hypothetical protein